MRHINPNRLEGTARLAAGRSAAGSVSSSATMAVGLAAGSGGDDGSGAGCSGKDVCGPGSSGGLSGFVGGSSGFVGGLGGTSPAPAVPVADVDGSAAG